MKRKLNPIFLDRANDHTLLTREDTELCTDNSLTKLNLEQIKSALVNFDQNGQILYCNHAFRALSNIFLGYCTESQDIQGIIKHIDRSLLQKLLLLQTEDVEFIHEHSLHINMAEQRNHYIWEGKLIQSKSNKQSVYALIVDDISIQRQTEYKLTQAKEKAEQADQLKTSFLSCMSHEIRTPMNHILGFLDLFKDPAITIEEREEYAQIMRQSSETLLGLIDNIIDVAKIESNQLSLKKDHCKLNKIFQSIAESSIKYRNNIKKNHIQFILTIPENSDHIHFQLDSKRLKQVLNNLIENAFNYTENGKVELGYLIDKDENIKFFVQDTGLGIEPNLHRIIFKRFRQIDNSLKKQVGGIGLGLSIAQGIIEKMDSKIILNSIQGKGSKFYFTLDSDYFYDEILASIQKPKQQDFRWQNKRCLVVCDDSISYNLIQLFLKKIGIQTTWIKEVELEMLFQEKKPIDIIIANIMNGNNILQNQYLELKKHFPHTPIISQTNATFDLISSDTQTPIFDYYLPKPINKQALYLKIEEIFNNLH